MKKVFAVFVFLILFSASTANASQFPNDAISIGGYINGTDAAILSTNGSQTFTLLYYSVQGNDSQYCGGYADSGAFMMGTDYGSHQNYEIFMSYKLLPNKSVHVYKQSSSNTCQYSLTYVPYDLSNVKNSETKLDYIDYKLNNVSFYVFLLLLGSIVYIIARFIFKLIQDISIGW